VQLVLPVQTIIPVAAALDFVASVAHGIRHRTRHC
jgi:hypothetical protein